MNKTPQDHSPRLPIIYLRNHVSKSKRRFAKLLRKNPTPAEARLWKSLRCNNLGYRIRRSVIIRGYIADFYCASAFMVIDVDGSVHDHQKEYDDRRDKAMAKLGILTLRFSNDRIFHDLNNVLLEIRFHAKSRENYRHTHRYELRHVSSDPWR